MDRATKRAIYDELLSKGLKPSDALHEIERREQAEGIKNITPKTQPREVIKPAQEKKPLKQRFTEFIKGSPEQREQTARRKAELSDIYRKERKKEEEKEVKRRAREAVKRTTKKPVKQEHPLSPRGMSPILKSRFAPQVQEQEPTKKSSRKSIRQASDIYRSRLF